MKYLLGFAMFCFLVFGLVKVLDWFGMDAPPKHEQLRGDFVEAALPVLNKIERKHQHDLNIGEELPEDAVSRLLSYAHSDDEKDVAKKLGDLLIIVNAQSDEYLGCDAKIRAALLSRDWPVSFYPECK